MQLETTSPANAESMRRAMTVYPCDLAISAVASDGGLVAELSSELAVRSSIPAEWSGEPAGPDAGPAELLDAKHSRVALVLHQHLWQHDARTIRDAAALRARLASRGDSICVLALDDTPVASWLASAPRYSLGESDRAGAVDFVADVIAAAGGAVKSKARVPSLDESSPRWPEQPTPFLAQPRAQTALRHELDDIAATLKSAVDRARAARPEGASELHVLPHRVIARFDDVAVSFSWVTGRFSTVSDGHLLVIAWRGVTNGTRGVAALKAASPFHERVYVADGNAADKWRWRADDRVRQPYASAQLAADWLARAFIAQSGPVR